MKSRLHLLSPLLKAKLSLDHKFTIYKSIIRPAWLYRVQLREPENPSNTRTLQALQSICLSLITFAFWYVTNKNLHKDLNIPTLHYLAEFHCINFYSKFRPHSNKLIKSLFSNSIIPKRLESQRPRDVNND